MVNECLYLVSTHPVELPHNCRGNLGVLDRLLLQGALAADLVVADRSVSVCFLFGSQQQRPDVDFDVYQQDLEV